MPSVTLMPSVRRTRAADPGAASRARSGAIALSMVTTPSRRRVVVDHGQGVELIVGQAVRHVGGRSSGVARDECLVHHLGHWLVWRGQQQVAQRDDAASGGASPDPRRRRRSTTRSGACQAGPNPLDRLGDVQVARHDDDIVRHDAAGRCRAGTAAGRPPSSPRGGEAALDSDEPSRRAAVPGCRRRGPARPRPGSRPPARRLARRSPGSAARAPASRARRRPATRPGRPEARQHAGTAAPQPGRRCGPAGAAPPCDRTSCRSPVRRGSPRSTSTSDHSTMWPSPQRQRRPCEMRCRIAHGRRRHRPRPAVAPGGVAAGRAALASSSGRSQTSLTRTVRSRPTSTISVSRTSRRTRSHSGGGRRSTAWPLRCRITRIGRSQAGHLLGGTRRVALPWRTISSVTGRMLIIGQVDGEVDQLSPAAGVVEHRPPGEVAEHDHG